MQQRPSNFAYLLLVLMSVVSMGGPFLIGWVMKGGERTSWPPDRTVEWVTFVGVTGAVVVLMLTILVYGMRLKKQFERQVAELKARKAAQAAASGDGAVS